MIHKYPELFIAAALLVLAAVCGWGVYGCESRSCAAAGGTLTGYRNDLCVTPDGRIITDW